MSVTALESCIGAVCRQIRQIRAQRRPRPVQLQRQVDQLLWQCCRELPLSRFQAVYATIADPLSPAHDRIRTQALVRHGRLEAVSPRQMSQRSVLDLVRYSVRLPDLRLFYQIWNQESDRIKENADAVWTLAIALSGRDSASVSVLTEVLSAVVQHESGSVDRLAQFLYDCVLRYANHAGFAAACQLVQQLVDDDHDQLLFELGLLLIKDQRCHQCPEFVRQCIDLIRPLAKQAQDDERIAKELRSIGISDEMLSIVSRAV